MFNFYYVALAIIYKNITLSISEDNVGWFQKHKQTAGDVGRCRTGAERKNGKGTKVGSCNAPFSSLNAVMLPFDL